MAFIDLSETQLKKLVKGKPVQLNANSVKGEGMGKYKPPAEVFNPALLKKIKKAMRLNKGCRIACSPQFELMEGSGFFGWLKKAAKNVIKIPIKVLQEASNILGKEQTRNLLQQGLVAATATKMPGLSSKLASGKARAGIDLVGEKMGFGMEACCQHCGGSGIVPAGSGIKPAGSGYQQQDRYGSSIAPGKHQMLNSQTHLSKSGLSRK